MKERFKKYLDNANDYDTIILALQDSDFEYCYDQMHDADYRTGDDWHVRTLFNFIRQVWDAAYNHGYHDAQADEGLTLAEMD